jgi:hypothetical protein
MTAIGHARKYYFRPSAVVQVSGKRTSNYFTRLVLKRVFLQYLDFFGSRHEAEKTAAY